MNEQKLKALQELAGTTMQRIYSGADEWMLFLNTAAKMYKYTFADQLMIHAQQPDATACAEYRIWNDVMHRYVKRGSHGIALLQESENGMVIRYVYDVSCTGTRKSSRNINAFAYRDEHEETVFSVLPEGDSLEERLFFCAKALLFDKTSEIKKQSADLQLH